MTYAIGCSGGNDSVALIQHMLDTINDPLGMHVIYNNTGWAHPDWAVRIGFIRQWCEARDISFYETKSEGLESLVRRKKGWPMPASNMQFCTRYLKEKPTLELLDQLDPEGEWVFVTGRRREESQNRLALAVWEHDSPRHGGRDCYNPLAMHDEAARDELLRRAGFKPLPHQSHECWPCVCANKKDLAQMPLDHPKIDKIEQIEIEMGFTRNGKPRTMFRPYRVGGGVGIRQAVEWGHGGRGHKATEVPEIYRQGEVHDGPTDDAYDPETPEGREFRRQCEGGYCGS